MKKNGKWSAYKKPVKNEVEIFNNTIGYESGIKPLLVSKSGKEEKEYIFMYNHPATGELASLYIQDKGDDKIKIATAELERKKILRGANIVDTKTVTEIVADIFKPDIITPINCSQSLYRINTGSIACLYINKGNQERYILTAHHNLKGNNRIYLASNGKEQNIKLKLFRFNEKLDYAILEVTPSSSLDTKDFNNFINKFLSLNKKISKQSCEKHSIISYKGIIDPVNLCGEEVLSDDTTNNIRLSVHGKSGYSGSGVIKLNISGDNELIGIYLGQFIGKKKLSCGNDSDSFIIEEPGRALSMEKVDDTNLVIY